MFEKKPVEVGEFRGDNIELEENSFIAGSTNDQCVSTDCSELEEPPTKGYIFEEICVVSQQKCPRAPRHVCVNGGRGKYHKGLIV